MWGGETGLDIGGVMSKASVCNSCELESGPWERGERGEVSMSGE